MDLYSHALLTGDVGQISCTDVGEMTFVCFCHSIPVLSVLVVLGLVSSVLRQEIGWEERP